MVKVKLFANLREAANGQRVVEYELGECVSATELLHGLVEKYGDKARKRLLSPSPLSHITQETKAADQK